MNFDRWKTLMGGHTFPALDLWIEMATTPELFRINLKVLAPALEKPLKEVLAIFLHGVTQGAFTLNWEYHCPHCNGIPDFKHNFKELGAEGFCGLCDLAFRNALDTNVEVTFTIHPSLHEIPPEFIQEYKNTAMAAIKNGTYEKPAAFLSGFECLNNPVYQNIFGADVLSSEESLEISRVTLLFTDIKGSTDMYSRLGDAVSYRIVRDHFKLLFQEVEAAGGVVVKTIGDAVMASFLRPVDGVRAALNAYEIFKRREWESLGKLEIKMGLHTGGVIVVNMNDRVDYFGNTVNKSARIQAVAENHTVCFTKEILDEPGVKSLLKAWTLKNSGKVIKNTVQLKGIQGDVDFYKIQE
ncbi:MAG: hypothetical protein A2Z96_05760 [Spirochaetes bacterium GWB1_48_6]|nr:MAG: hypothetical protein A2Z96_05760 [Spirochaetes bacterium GWB1_48_6]